MTSSHPIFCKNWKKKLKLANFNETAAMDVACIQEILDVHTPDLTSGVCCFGVPNHFCGNFGLRHWRLGLHERHCQSLLSEETWSWISSALTVSRGSYRHPALLQHHYSTYLTLTVDAGGCSILAAQCSICHGGKCFVKPEPHCTTCQITTFFVCKNKIKQNFKVVLFSFTP